MNLTKINFFKIINLILLGILYISFIKLFDKGFDYSDESYYILSSIYPNEIENFETYFHYFTSFLFHLSNQNLLNFRILGFLLLIFSSVYFSNSYFRYSLLNKMESKYSFYFNVFALVSIIFYYFQNLFTPSYNLLNLSFILLLFGSMFNFLLNKNFSYIRLILVSFIYFALCINKITSGIVVLPYIVFFLFKNFSKKKIITFSLSFLLFSLFLFLNDNYNFVVNYISDLSQSTSQEIRAQKYLKLDITISNINDVYHRLLNYRFIYFYLTISLISIILKYNLNSHIVLIILFKNFLTLSLTVWHDAFYLLIYNLFCFCFLHKDIYKKNIFNLLFLFSLSFAYYYGTNVELSKFLSQSSIFTFIALIFLFLNNYNFKIKEIITNLIIIMVLINGFQLKYVIKKKEYFVKKKLIENDQLFNSKYNKKLFKNIKIRKELVNFNVLFENILQENDWKSGNVFLEATLKHPGMLLIANGKFQDSPWYFHKKKYLLSALSNIDKNNPPWFIINPNHTKVKILIFNKFENSKFISLGVIKHPYSKKNIEIFKPI